MKLFHGEEDKGIVATYPSRRTAGGMRQPGAPASAGSEPGASGARRSASHPLVRVGAGSAARNGVRRFTPPRVTGRPAASEAREMPRFW